MTIPPELAALRRYEMESIDRFIGGESHVEEREKDAGEWLKYADVARAWPQRASGEAVGYVDKGGFAMLLAGTIKELSLHRRHSRYDQVPLFTHPADPSALRAIATERQRQIDSEGWTHEHDDEHGDDEIAEAAAAYALPSETRRLLKNLPGSTWVKGGERIRELVKAGALIVAEIERLERARTLLAGEGNG